jgi:hypothetical protein
MIVRPPTPRDERALDAVDDDVIVITSDESDVSDIDVDDINNGYDADYDDTDYSFD